MSKVDKKLDAAKENDRAEEIYNRVMSNVFHVAIQKGRIVGRMEAAGKSVEEIAKAISVPVDSVNRMLEEDPNQYINKWHEEVSGDKANDQNNVDM